MLDTTRAWVPHLRSLRAPDQVVHPGWASACRAMCRCPALCRHLPACDSYSFAAPL